MDNVDLKIMPVGSFEFFVNVTYPSADEGPIGSTVIGQWSLTGAQPWPRTKAPIPANDGDYRFDHSASQISFFDRSGIAIMSLDNFVVPPVPTTSGSGTLEFDPEQGTAVTWMVS